MLDGSDSHQIKHVYRDIVCDTLIRCSVSNILSICWRIEMSYGTRWAFYHVRISEDMFYSYYCGLMPKKKHFCISVKIKR